MAAAAAGWTRQSADDAAVIAAVACVARNRSVDTRTMAVWRAAAAAVVVVAAAAVEVVVRLVRRRHHHRVHPVAGPAVSCDYYGGRCIDVAVAADAVAGCSGSAAGVCLAAVAGPAAQWSWPGCPAEAFVGRFAAAVTDPVVVAAAVGFVAVVVVERTGSSAVERLVELVVGPRA